MKFPLLSFLLIASGHVALGQSPYAALQVPKQIQYQGRVATGTGGAWAGTEPRAHTEPGNHSSPYGGGPQALGQRATVAGTETRVHTAPRSHSSLHARGQ